MSNVTPGIGNILGGVLWLWGWILSHGGWAWLAFFVPVYAWYVAVMHILGHWGI